MSMLYMRMFLAMVAYSSLHRVTIQDSSLLSSGQSNCSKEVGYIPGLVLQADPSRHQVRVDVLPDPIHGQDVFLLHAASREAGGQVDQQGVVPQDKQKGERPAELVSIVPTVDDAGHHMC